MTARESTRSALIGVATTAGFVLAGWQALMQPEFAEADAAEPVAARVNDRSISKASLARAVEAIARDKQSPLLASDRARALDTLITEELLIQQAMAIGLVDEDRAVRAAVVDAMIQTVAARANASLPDDDTLRRFYADHPLIGAQAGRVRIRHATRPWPAATAVEALRSGQPFESVLTDASAVRLPDAWLRIDQLDRYLPPTVVHALRQQQAGDIIGPMRVGEQAHFVWLQAVEPGSRPDFADLRPQLLDAWQQRAREQAVADYVARLREQADIRING